MSFLSKFYNYSKEGPGVTKKENETGIGKFFRILKAKFWKICSLNLLFVACMLPILAMCIGLYTVTPLSENSLTEDYLRKNNVSNEFCVIAEKLVETYGVDDKTMIELNAKLGRLIKTVKEVNPDLITYGSDEFDSKKFDSEINAEISTQFKDILTTIKKDTFDVKFDEKEGRWNIVDTKSDYVLMAFSIDGSKFNLYDYIPNNYSDYFYWVLVLLPLALIGPATAGIVRVTRDLVREEPVFLFSDFKDAIKRNFKQSLIISIIQYVSVAIILNAISLYYNYLGGNWIYTFAFAAALFLAFIFVAMHFYIMLMQVTLKLNLKKIYKNAFFFSIICLFRNILLMVGIAAIIFLVWVLFIIGQAYPLVMGFLFLVLFTFLIAFMFFVVMYTVYPPIKRVVIDPYYAEHTEETSAAIKKQDKTPEIAEKTAENTVSATPDTVEETETEESEYVYHNGRMVHRSALENDSLFKD